MKCYGNGGLAVVLRRSVHNSGCTNRGMQFIRFEKYVTVGSTVGVAHRNESSAASDIGQCSRRPYVTAVFLFCKFGTLLKEVFDTLFYEKCVIM